ncbi:kinesin family member 6 [Polychytrium aggregatum]|uniref:kinesin family member 6 n=1 Tax=Polychytrium aggregatum TaxID=110093 RepID=UPI0022FF0852|nr:kinesin family member 6 [Polychytrium aggregatum]KAI9206079.1 kinesin family member 6 [Polychytrium aggregatum]
MLSPSNAQDVDTQSAVAGDEPATTVANSTIKIYARVRPLRTTNAKLRVTPGRYWIEAPIRESMHDTTSFPVVGFRMPRDETQGLVNNQRESFEFKFDHIFNVDTNQEEVFDLVAKDVVLSALEGYNGTIFAYGQTGSGKTFTITGGAEKYADRGLIPRSLQFIFSEIKKRTDCHYEVSISYLEIYNESGYDLLDSSRDAKKLEDLPKVALREDSDQNIHIGNLSAQPAINEEEALNLLFIGDTNRMIAETPSNPASSRSHCIFIISLVSKKEGGDRIRRSKLHLVDLAGSERTSRTGINGTLLKEATYINLSLHFLEQVIIALHEKSQGRRVHVPYRNSMMTSVLRDSLGGNCKTTMIATLAVEDQLIDESISTCRFAQRVALISNKATLNEEIDPQLVIVRLKKEIVRLRAELALARGESSDMDGDLPDYEKERIKQAVRDYLGDPTGESLNNLFFGDYRKISYAFSAFKELGQSAAPASKVTGRIKDDADSVSTRVETAPAPASALGSVSSAELDRLRGLVSHRDNEINILVGMLSKYKEQLAARSSDHSLPQAGQASTGRDSETSQSSQLDAIHPWDRFAANPNGRDSKYGTQPDTAQAHNQFGSHSAVHHPSPQPVSIPRAPLDSSKSEDKGAARKAAESMISTEKAKAFEIFKSGYPSSGWIDGQKAILKEKYSLAKALGEQAHDLRSKIKNMKSSLDAAGDETGNNNDAVKAAIGDHVQRYKKAYQQLKDLKIEIEHLHHLLEQARHRLTRDFEHCRTADEETLVTSHARRHDPVAPKGESGSPAVPKWQSDSSIYSARSYLDQPRSAVAADVGQTIGSSTDYHVKSEVDAFYQAREKTLRSLSRTNNSS